MQLKFAKPTATVTIVTLLFTLQATAQSFDAGSDGSFGAINVTDGVVALDVPADGIFNCTTINVAQGATLTFNRNANNTSVHLLATGNIDIDGNVDVSGGQGNSTSGGRGGPGGFDGGVPGFNTFAPGAGHGPGAGLGGINTSDGVGSGSYGSRTQSNTDDNDGQTYGSPLLMPLLGGSGGGGIEGSPGGGGGGGGGAVLLASNIQVEINGTISARGGPNFTSGWWYNGGSGGAVRIVAPMVKGTGAIDVRASNTSGGTNLAGHGRIRIDTIDKSGLPTLTFAPFPLTSIGTFMRVFPPNDPKLDILEAAGQNIPEGTNGEVSIELPFNAPTSQTVVVQATGFDGTVPIRVVLTPETGAPAAYDTDIAALNGNPAQTTVNVEMPVNTRVQIHAWTREP